MLCLLVEDFYFVNMYDVGFSGSGGGGCLGRNVEEKMFWRFFFRIF